MSHDQGGTEARFHDDLYGGEDDTVARSAVIRAVRVRFVGEFVKTAQLSKSSRVLSLGCGTGAIEQLLAPHVGSVVGTEVSTVALERARASARDAGIANLEFIHHDLARGALPWPEAKFDAICVFGVLHHLPPETIGPALQEMRRVLVPEGTAFSVDPSARRFVALFKPLFRRSYEMFHSPGERELDPSEIRRMYREAGFREVAIDYVDSFLIPLGFLAPRFPQALVPGVVALDRILRSIPGLRSRASSFSIAARR